jgi:hypothetical protein
MERITITIHPAPSDEGLLRVTDAMRQVLDLLRVHEDADRAMAAPDQAFEWRLVSASTNSPFTIVAQAEPLYDSLDVLAVESHARHVKAEVAAGMRKLIQTNEPSWWMGPDSISAFRDMFARNQNGISTTEIETGPNEVFSIDRSGALAGLEAIGGITAAKADAEIPGRVSWGEIRGTMLAVGHYYLRPAIFVRTHQYGDIWCRLSAELIEPWGGEHRIEEVWKNQLLAIKGDLVYGRGGKLSRVEAEASRPIKPEPRIGLEVVQDPYFTAGLDPAEYVRQLWEGSLA